MPISMFDKNDFKGITTLSIISMIESLNKNQESDKNNKIIIMTSFGIIQADEVLKRDYNFNVDSDEIVAPDYLFQLALNNRDEILKEHNNEDLLLQQTSLVLKNVQIKSFGSNATTNLPIMILFSEDIIGITLGQID